MFTSAGIFGWVACVEGFKGSADNSAELANGWIIKADTIAELAQKIGRDPVAVQATIDRWNASCAAGKDEQFDFTGDDTRAPYTRPAARLVPVHAPGPFYAIAAPSGHPQHAGWHEAQPQVSGHEHRGSARSRVCMLPARTATSGPSCTSACPTPAPAASCMAASQARKPPSSPVGHRAAAAARTATRKCQVRSVSSLALSDDEPDRARETEGPGCEHPGPSAFAVWCGMPRRRHPWWRSVRLLLAGGLRSRRSAPGRGLRTSGARRT